MKHPIYALELYEKKKKAEQNKMKTQIMPRSQSRKTHLESLRVGSNHCIVLEFLQMICDVQPESRINMQSQVWIQCFIFPNCPDPPLKDAFEKY